MFKNIQPYEVCRIMSLKSIRINHFRIIEELS